jgi:hypothetical protein
MAELHDDGGRRGTQRVKFSAPAIMVAWTIVIALIAATAGGVRYALELQTTGQTARQEAQANTKALSALTNTLAQIDRRLQIAADIQWSRPQAAQWARALKTDNQGLVVPDPFYREFDAPKAK